MFGLLKDIVGLSPLAAVSSGNENGLNGVQLNTIGGNQQANIEAITTIAKGKAAEAAALALAADRLAAAASQRPKSRRRPPVGVADDADKDKDDDDDDDKDDELADKRNEIAGRLPSDGTSVQGNVKESLGAATNGGLLRGGGGGASNVVSGLLGALRPAAAVQANTKIGV